MIRLVLLLALIHSFSALSVVGQSSDSLAEGSTIRGTLYLDVDSTRQATTIIATIAKASVSLYAAADSTRQEALATTTSTYAGTYALTDVPPGRYLVVMRHPDHPERRALIEISKPRIYRLDFYPPGNLRQIGEILLAPIRKSF